MIPPAVSVRSLRSPDTTAAAGRDTILRLICVLCQPQLRVCASTWPAVVSPPSARPTRRTRSPPATSATRGSASRNYVNHPERVASSHCGAPPTAASSRSSGTWRSPRSAARLSEIRSRHSPRAIGSWSGIGGHGEPHGRPLRSSVFSARIGSRRWFNAFAQEKTQHALMDQWNVRCHRPRSYFHVDQRNTRASCSSSAPTRANISKPRPQPDRDLQALRRG